MLGCAVWLCVVHLFFAGGTPSQFPAFQNATAGYFPAPTQLVSDAPYGTPGEISGYLDASVQWGSYHSYSASGAVWVVVTGIPTDNAAFWAALSHEIVEAEDNPYGQAGWEAADGCPWFYQSGFYLSQYRRSASGPCED